MKKGGWGRGGKTRRIRAGGGWEERGRKKENKEKEG